MNQRPALTTRAGAPVADDQHSERAGSGGPTLLQDHHLVEKLARFDRERIPGRAVHAVGTGAYGQFEVTHDVTPWTKMRTLSDVGKRTEMYARFSRVADSKGAADTARDPRGFALEFYTEEATWDLVGNNTASRATVSSSPTSSTRRSPTRTPTARSRTTSWTSSRTLY